MTAQITKDALIEITNSLMIGTLANQCNSYSDCLVRIRETLASKTGEDLKQAILESIEFYDNLNMSYEEEYRNKKKYYEQRAQA